MAEESIPLVKLRDGAQWYRVKGMPGTDAPAQWVAVYTIPGTKTRISFTASRQQMNAIFGKGEVPEDHTSTNADRFERLGTYYSGDVSRMEGEESFASAYERAVLAGLGMNRLPESLRDNERILGLVFLAAHNDKDDEWLYGEIAKTRDFKQRFGGIEKFREQGLDWVTSVKSYLSYETSVNELAKEVVGKELSAVQMSRLITRGHSLTLVQDSLFAYKHLTENIGAMQAFNEVLTRRGVDPLDEDGFYDFMSGRSPGALYDIWEESSVLQSARDAGLDAGIFAAKDAAQVRRAAVGRLGYEHTFSGLQTAAQQLLQFRTEINLGQLNQDDLIDLSLGIAPRSGGSVVDIAREMSRAVNQASSFIERKKVTPHRSFSAGVPQAASLLRGRRESV